VWARRLLADFGFPQIQPTTLHMDNQAAIQSITNPVFHKKTKHVDLKYHLVREFYHQNLIAPLYISTKDQVADILTKPLSPAIFNKHRIALNMLPLQ
jgi:hypothetical protein